MADRLSQEIAQLLAEPEGDGRTDALVRARLTADIAEGLDGSPRDGATGAGDRMRNSHSHLQQSGLGLWIDRSRRAIAAERKFRPHSR